MLVITRKEDETVCIGDNIRVTVVQVRGKQVRLGIEAPPGLLVLREEAGAKKKEPESE
jgi:carbon storage regulator